MSDSIATSKLADEFLQESSMTKEELQNYHGMNQAQQYKGSSPLREESSITLPSNYLLQSSTLDQHDLRKSDMFATDENGKLLSSFMNSNPTNGAMT